MLLLLPCRSNLAKTWFGYELQRRHPELTVPLCHPGVIDSGLTVVPTELLQRIKASLLISPTEGDVALTMLPECWPGLELWLVAGWDLGCFAFNSS